MPQLIFCFLCTESFCFDSLPLCATQMELGKPLCCTVLAHSSCDAILLIPHHIIFEMSYIEGGEDDDGGGVLVPGLLVALPRLLHPCQPLPSHQLQPLHTGVARKTKRQKRQKYEEVKKRQNRQKDNLYPAINYSHYIQVARKTNRQKDKKTKKTKYKKTKKTKRQKDKLYPAINYSQYIQVSFSKVVALLTFLFFLIDNIMATHLFVTASFLAAP